MTSKEDLRRVTRQPGSTFGPLRLTTGPGVEVQADVQDISILGIGMLVDLEFPVGSDFVVESMQGRAPVAPLLANLRHARRRQDDRWLLGCSFSRTLTGDDVAALA